MFLFVVKNIKNRKLNISFKNLNCVCVINVFLVDLVVFLVVKFLMELKIILVWSSFKLIRVVNVKGWLLIFCFR